MRENAAVDTIFFDIGGVCLTNGWDTAARKAAASHFSLDLDELEARHDPIVEAFERGECTLDEYLDRVIFHRRRTFSREAFITFMQAQSQPYDPALSLVRKFAAAGAYRLATINNESRELNRYRIDTFALREVFCAFFSSCYLGVRKPHPRIYALALDMMQADPAACLFVDDREENVAGARTAGMRTIHVTEPAGLAEQLMNAGVKAGG